MWNRGRHIFYLVYDLLITFGVTFLSFATFIFRSNVNEAQIGGILVFCGAISILTVLCFIIFRVYHIVTSYFSLYDAIRISIITFLIQLVGFVIGLIVYHITHDTYFIRPSVAAWALSTFSLMLLYCGVRFIIRGANIFFNFKKKYRGTKTIIIGAGAASKIAIDELNQNPLLSNKIVAIVDDNPSKIGGFYSGIQIVGPISDIEAIVNKYQAEEVVIAICNISDERLAQIIAFLEPLSVRIKRLPLLSEMSSPDEIKIHNVNIHDLLQRKKVILYNEGINLMLQDQTILITGAGGSIGSELSRQIFEYHPKKMILFDIYENSVHDITQELKIKLRQDPSLNTEIVTLVGATYNLATLEAIFKNHKIDYIYHAAAYKHVPLMEDAPKEAIRTNIIGTYNVALLADRYHAKKMLLVSTDKAVRPTNVMGCSKRYAELVLTYFAKHSKNTNFCMVRFGNVLGSNGSVVPLFAKQIAAGGPITVTDPNIIRYFMSIPEAVGLILNCSLLAKDGELFILDMGTPINITTLAERMIRQAGLIPNKDIKIIYTGLRPGEKLYEELLLDKDHQEKTSNGLIYIEKSSKVDDIKIIINNVTSLMDIDDKNKIKEEMLKGIKPFE